jgi:hypothetical protein
MTYIYIILLIISLLFTIWFGRVWTIPVDNRKRISQSLIIGIGILLMLFFGIKIYDSYTKNNSFENISTILFGLCLIIPFVLMAIIGTYLSQGFLRKMSDTADKIKDNTKKDK